MKRLIAMVALLVAATAANAGVIAIRDARVITVGRDGTLDKATVLIRNGRIDAVGANLEIPAGAKIVDGAGRVLTPGIIVARTDAEAANLLEGRSDERDQPFLLGVTNLEVPPYKSCFLAMIRRFHEQGVTELNGHLLYAVPEGEYAVADAWLAGHVPGARHLPRGHHPFADLLPECDVATINDTTGALTWPN